MIENFIFSLILLPVLIFVARVADVTLGTLRIVFISQGRRKLAPLVGFFEILIWLVAMGQIFSNLTNFVYYIAYAGGFATGNYIGLIVENKISLGLLSLQLIIRENPETLINLLKDQGYSLTTMTAEGTKGFVKIVYLVIKRKTLPKTLETIRTNNPKAFISIEEVKSVSGGNFPQVKRWDLFKRKKIK
ncbi:MAG: DUF2179 domain-containing protein [Candidatus Lokiarchaeota archaeon]|nr:DUF2179 domain-containing protein [Candidatus Lokiarchaeota archaeon]